MISKQHRTSSTGTKGNIWRTGLGQNIAMAIYHHPDSWDAWDAFIQSLAQNINILVKIIDFPANFTYTWLLTVVLMTWMWLLWAGQRGSWQRHNDGQRWKELKVKRCTSHFLVNSLNPLQLLPIHPRDKQNACIHACNVYILRSSVTYRDIS